MGTTLTGTTPQTTYDSLIKVTDNGPLGGSLKTLTDGLGNDSALALSTGAASVTGTLAVSSNLTVDTDTLFVDAANNRVGIGTTSNYSFNDDAKLAVANTAGNSTISIVSSTSGIGYLAFADGTSGTDRYTGSINYNHSTNAMTLHTNAGNERMIITSSGLVGIGTSSPSIYSTLTLNKDGASEYSSVLATNANSTAALYVGVGGSSVGNTALRNNAYVLNASASDLILGTSDTERLRITSTGNVGIGTSSPNAKLVVVGDGNGTAKIGGVGIGGDYTGFSLNGTLDISSYNLLSSSTTDNNLYINRPTGNDIYFRLANNDQVTIKASGNVGIGTSSPTSKLVVNGDIATSGNIALTGSGAGIFLGGSIGSANGLDDYEEGTWTPTLGGTWSTNPTSLSGTYTKIGNMVYIRLDFTGGVKSSSVAGWFDGLPFSGAVGGGGTVSNVNVQNKGIALLDNDTRVWVTETDFGGLVTKVMASYRI